MSAPHWSIVLAKSTWFLFTSVYFDTTVLIGVQLINTVESTHLYLVLVGFHGFQIFPDRMSRAWSVKVGKHIFSLSLFRPSCQSNPSPRRAKEDSNVTSSGRTRLVKCPSPGPTKTIKSPPHASPRWLYIDRCIKLSESIGFRST